MKKVFSVILIIVGLTLLSVFTVSAAEEGITYDLSEYTAAFPMR